MLLFSQHFKAKAKTVSHVPSHNLKPIGLDFLGLGWNVFTLDPQPGTPQFR
jgi:hypothetical protein